MNSLLNLDYRLFAYFNSWAGKNPVFDAIVIFFAHWAVYFLAAGLAASWFFNGNKLKSRQALVMAFISFIAARFAIAELIRSFAPRSRPFLAHQVTQLIVKDAEKSFPSGHATALFAIAAAIYFYNKKLGAWLFVIAALVSLARVIAGAHYPLDILGGAVLGIAAAWFFHRFFKEKFEAWTIKISGYYDKILPFTKS